MAWTEAVTQVSSSHVPDSVYEWASKHVDQKQLVDLTTAVIAINSGNRTAVNPDGTFKSIDELHGIYVGQRGVHPNKDTIAYCRIGERSSHTWFVLKYLLGFNNVKNYDGSWTEYGNLVGVPLKKG